MTAAIKMFPAHAADSSPILVPRLMLVPRPERPAEPDEVDVGSLVDLLAGEQRWQNRISWFYVPLIALSGALLLLNAPSYLALAAGAVLVSTSLGNLWVVRWSLGQSCRDLGVSAASLRESLRAVRRAHSRTTLLGLTGSARHRKIAELIAADGRR